MSNKTNKYSPTSEDGARFDYNQLRERLSYLREKIIKEQDLLDITPNDNIDLKRDCLEKLKVFKVELRKTENEFESVKRWFDKNNLPYPYSEEDQEKKEQSRKLREDYLSRKRKKVDKIFGNPTKIKDVGLDGIPLFLSKWAKEVVRILLENGELKHQEILLYLKDAPTSYNHISKIFKTSDAKEFFQSEIVNNSAYYSLRDPSQYKK